MIIVVGVPWLLRGPAHSTFGGLGARIAAMAAAAGPSVQLIGKVGDDAAGDELLLALGGAGVGHVAVLRPPATATPVGPVGHDALLDRDGDPLAIAAELEATRSVEAPARPAALTLDAADLELGFRYLVDFRVIVVTESLDPASVRVVADAAAYAGAETVVVAPATGGPPVGLDRATVLTFEEDDPDGTFADLVARFAVGLERGEDPAAALQAAVEATGSAPVSV